MAKKNDSISSDKSKVGKFKKIFTDERTRLMLAIILFVSACYLVLAFISYLFTWKADQSFLFQKLVSTADIKVENWGGKMGARVGNYFMNDLFGIASFSIPFLFIIIAFRLLNVRLLPLGRTVRLSIVLTLLSSVFLSYITGNQGTYLGSGIGGSYGFIIIDWLNSFLGPVGNGLLLMVIIFAFLFFSFKLVADIVRNYLREHKILVSTDFDKLEAEKLATMAHLSNIEQPVEAIKQEPVIGIDDIVFETEKIMDENESVKSAEITDILNNIEDETIALAPEDYAEMPIVPIPNNPPEAPFAIEGYNETPTLDESEISLAEFGEYDPTLDLSHYKLPPLDLMDQHESKNSEVSNEELVSNKNKIVETLANYKISIVKIKATIGPTVTLYEIVPAAGVRISKIKNLEDDIALSLSALGIRIIAPIPGKGTIGIEVPNQNPQIVSMRTILSSRKFIEHKGELTIAIGKTISNETFVFDLAKMPHLLVAGATGQGKSVGLNAIITSLLYKKHPSQLKFVFIDPKKVELSIYSKIEKHFLAKLPDTQEPIITDVQKVIYTLNSLTIEMDARYDLLKKAHVRNIMEYNEKFIARKLNPNNGHMYLPYIVLVIDEFADLIMTAGKEIEMPIARLAQLARAIGIHLIIATQRPTTNIITGVIKANFPARVAFRVSSMIDSRTILDSPGANQLIGRGDMLITQGSDLIRVQCALVDTPEVERLTDFIGNQKGYPTAFYLPEYVAEGSEAPEVDMSKKDGLFEEAARIVVIHQQGSTSLIQRKFSIGYNRAGRIIDQLEAAGIVGPFEGSKARQVLIMDEMSLENQLKNYRN